MGGGGGGGRRAALVLLLAAAAAAGAAALGAAQDGPGGGGGGGAGSDPLSRLGRAAWDALERGVGREPLQLVAESLSAALWTVSLGISAALATLCGILGDLLAALGLNGDALRSAALGPGEVQRLLLWGLAVLLCSWLLSRLLALLLDLLVSALWWVKLCCFLRAFLYVVSSQQSPTAQAGLLLALWVLHALLGRLAGARGPGARLEAAVRSLEWQVEELRRRQKFGGPRNRQDD